MTDDNTLKEFTVFGDLPIELRLKVWNHAFPPRVSVLLETSGVFSGSSKGLNASDVWYFSATE